jgi:hypothetical protein
MNGFRWRDYSDYVVHFTKSSPKNSEYSNMMSICGSRRLYPANRFGIGNNAPPSIPQEAVCFSEIPLHELSRLAKRRSRYGIGFSKDFISSKGGCPVWYVPKDSATAEALQALTSEALQNRTSASQRIWELTTFIDFPGDYPTGTYRFEWEREWRVRGSLSFTESDVAFLVIPEELHQAARGFFQDAIAENIGPGYLCPYIDPCWDWETVTSAFNASS